MFTGFLLLLLLSGGSTFNHTEPLDDQLMNDNGGSTSGDTEPPGDQQIYNQSYSGGGSIYVDLRPDYYQVYGYMEETDFDTWKVEYHKDESKCTHAAIINELNLTNKVMFCYTRPAKNYSKPTEVTLDVHLFAILDVRDKEQELVTHIWINTIWRNPLITWNSSEYCGIPSVYYPAERLWNPDIMIDEMTEKDKATQISYLAIYHTGSVFLRNGMVLVSTCKMQFYKFPFDIQSCNLTFKSISMSARDLKLSPNKFPGMDGLSQEALQYEWLPVNITVTSEVVKNYGILSSTVVYTIIMKRRSVLYVVNFILPTLFFFCLDLASFLILDSGGEKLSFKVTVLLAVTVMQLILNDILPSSSDRIPLIAVYCIGVFGLMMMSLLETILVMYLMQKDKDKHQSLNEDSTEKQGKFQNCFRDKPLLMMVKEGSSSLLTEEPHDLQKLSNNEREVILSNIKEEVKPGYWTKVAKTINTIYLILHFTSASLFLGILFSCWFDEDNN